MRNELLTKCYDMLEINEQPDVEIRSQLNRSIVMCALGISADSGMELGPRFYKSAKASKVTFGRRNGTYSSIFARPMLTDFDKIDVSSKVCKCQIAQGISVCRPEFS